MMQEQVDEFVFDQLEIQDLPEVEIRDGSLPTSTSFCADIGTHQNNQVLPDSLIESLVKAGLPPFPLKVDDDNSKKLFPFSILTTKLSNGEVRNRDFLT